MVFYLQIIYILSNSIETVESNVSITMEVDEVLAQFGCMQTQDKEELVNQMLRLVGTNINYTTARFYLEMNQWNVQAAVCSYFDLETVNSTLPGERLSLSCFPTDPM